MAESNKAASVVDLITPATNKNLPVSDCRSLSILSKPGLEVAYKAHQLARDRKRSQYLKSPYVDPNNIKKRVGITNEIESQYCEFKNDPNRL